ncbi:MULTISPECIES: hypothetical protein [unclassified Actinopolyspora]|nr:MULTISPECIES: hypothetical protein [unclassified Actinopolyspora]NHD19309.1 hypothetical protein [Actinopolyspora sp. BKK2]NHE78433.1 hypothetical protein [Actinopolyspora sp. BKK1]
MADLLGTPAEGPLPNSTPDMLDKHTGESSRKMLGGSRSLSVVDGYRDQ